MIPRRVRHTHTNPTSTAPSTPKMDCVSVDYDYSIWRHCHQSHQAYTDQRSHLILKDYGYTAMWSLSDPQQHLRSYTDSSGVPSRFVCTFYVTRPIVVVPHPTECFRGCCKISIVDSSLNYREASLWNGAPTSFQLRCVASTSAKMPYYAPAESPGMPSAYLQSTSRKFCSTAFPIPQQ